MGLNRAEDFPRWFFAFSSPLQSHSQFSSEKKGRTMNPLIQLKKIPSLIVVAVPLAWFGLTPMAHAVVPPPDGGYPGFNTATGTNALQSLTTGVGNAAVGWYSLFSNTDGSFNTALGAGTLLFNIGDQSTGAGTQNTAIGTAALLNNTTGGRNTAIGVQALLNNTTAGVNTAVGVGSLLNNVNGDANSALGQGALAANTNGQNNTAVGFGALSSNTSGSANIALGALAGSNLTGDLNINIGNTGIAGESGTIRIGNSIDHARTFIAGIHAVNEGGTGILPVYINSANQLGTSSSSRRFKKEIKPMDKASEAILSLKPVTFEYKDDGSSTPQFGLIAEEVAEVNSALVVRDKNGEIYTVRYDAVNAMLLNEFLKEHKAFLEEHRTVEELKKEVAVLTAGLHKVSAQLEASKPAPQVVLNNQ
jgi:hypothetical protein